MTTSNFRATYGAALAFAGLAFVGGWAIEHSAHAQSAVLYRGQIAACQRTNDLRVESNRRIPSHQADTKVLHDFLLDAAQARLSNWHATHLPSDKIAATQYAREAKTLDAKVHFRPVKIVNCTKVIPKP